MLKNLASSLFLTERDTDSDAEENSPKVKGRIVTTLHKAKEVRPLVEKCVTIARHSLKAEQEAEQYATTAERNTEAWREWRNSGEWNKWNQAISPAVTARRRVVKLIGDKEAMRVLFAEVAPKFEDRDGGYTRILRLAKPRVGDAGLRAVLEFVGVRDREKQVSEKPAFDAGSEVDETATEEVEETVVDRAVEDPADGEQVAIEPETGDADDSSEATEETADDQKKE
jgi:large subunit ribosomal protein L17